MKRLEEAAKKHKCVFTEELIDAIRRCKRRRFPRFREGLPPVPGDIIVGMAPVGLLLGAIAMMATLGCRSETQPAAQATPASEAFFIGRELDKEVVIQKYNGLPNARVSAGGETRIPVASETRILNMYASPDGRWLATRTISADYSTSQCILVDTVSMKVLSVIDSPLEVHWTSVNTLSVYRPVDRPDFTRYYRRTTLSPPTWTEKDAGSVTECPSERAFSEEVRERVKLAVMDADIDWPRFWRHTVLPLFGTNFADDHNYATASANGEVVVVYGHLAADSPSGGDVPSLEDHLIVLRQDEGYEPRVLPGTFRQPKILKIWRDWLVVVSKREDGSLVRFFDLHDRKEVWRARGDMFCGVR